MGMKNAEARRKYDRPPRLSFTLWNTHTGLAPHDFCGLELRHHQYVFLFKYIVFLSFVYRFRLQIYGDSFNLQTKPEFFLWQYRIIESYRYRCLYTFFNWLSGCGICTGHGN